MATVLARFSHSSVLRLLLIIACALGPLNYGVRAQSTAQPLITRSINESSLVVLKGNVHPLVAQARFDRGPVSAAMPMQRLLLVLKRTPQQERSLQQYLASLEDENSPDFRHYLTPDQFGEQYGPAEEDIQQLVAWLNREGFSVTKMAKSRMVIEFSGTSNQVEAAFHTQLH